MRLKKGYTISRKLRFADQDVWSAASFPESKAMYVCEAFLEKELLVLKLRFMMY